MAKLTFKQKDGPKEKQNYLHVFEKAKSERFIRNHNIYRLGFSVSLFINLLLLYFFIKN